ncbi:MAG: response regulator [Candidatus Rokubacteria bacterium]|nr:response regulator [Candidatus Rokubacteria bacterium]
MRPAVMEKARILVVDDEAHVRELLKDFLERKGYAVSTAPDGAEALSAVQEQKPQLVLLDVRMPGMDGLETLRRIRAVDRTVGVIMLTALHDEDIAKEAMRREAYDYVTKPVSLRYLELAVLTRLAQAERSVG